MNKTLMAMAILPFLAGVALAAQPVPLNDTQMDKVTAGHDFSVLEFTNQTAIGIAIDETAVAVPGNVVLLGSVSIPVASYFAWWGVPVTGP
jgi:hypothetical protein